MKLLKTLTVLVSALVASACAAGPPAFSAPLAPPAGLAYDQRLIGTWYQFSQHENENRFKTLIVSPDEKGVLEIVSTLVKSHRYVLTGDPTELFFTIGDYDLYQRADFRAYPVMIEGETYYVGELQQGVHFFQDDEKPALVAKVDASELAPERLYILARARIDDAGLLILDMPRHSVIWERGFEKREIFCGEQCRLFVYDLSPAEQVKLIRSETADGVFFEFGRYLRRRRENPPPQND